MICIENEDNFNNAIVCLNPSIHKCVYIFIFTVMKAAQMIFTLFLLFFYIFMEFKDDYSKSHLITQEYQVMISKCD